MNATQSLAVAMLIFMLGSTVLQLSTSPRFAHRRAMLLKAATGHSAAVTALRMQLQEFKTVRVSGKLVAGIIGFALAAAGMMALQGFLSNH